MERPWNEIFKNRLSRFKQTVKRYEDGRAVSIKIRPISGCFHREHSPEAYKIIDQYLESFSPDIPVSFEEHESGPEIIVYVVSGINLTVSIINLITAIIKARSEGIKKGDTKREPLELIVRGTYEDGKYYEEKILRINSMVTAELIEKAFKENKSVKDLGRKRNKQ